MSWRVADDTITEKMITRLSDGQTFPLEDPNLLSWIGQDELTGVKTIEYDLGNLTMAPILTVEFGDVAKMLASPGCRSNERYVVVRHSPITDARIAGPGPGYGDDPEVRIIEPWSSTVIEAYPYYPPVRDAPNGSELRLDITKFADDLLQELIAEAREEVFTDDWESAFSIGLTRLIHRCGEGTIQAITGYIICTHTNIEVVGEIMRVLGGIKHPATQDSRVTLLLAGLRSPDPRVRDAASLGISALDDSHLLAAVQAAAARETIPELRKDLQQVADQLESTSWHII